MSHSTCMIVLPREPKGADDLNELLAEALAPFDEGLDVEPYKVRVAPAPDGWEVTTANRKRFDALKASGVEHRAAWRQVWGEENTDPRLEWPRSIAADEGIDPANDRAVIDWYEAKYPDSRGNYLIDDEGMFEWSTYNPQSRWDWWTLGGRWMGYFKVDPDATSYLGQPGTFDNQPSSTVGAKSADCCQKGGVQVDAMTLARAAEAGGWWDQAHERYPHDADARLFMSDVEPGESRDAYVLRKAEPADVLRPFAVMAEGCWREAGRMGWFGADSSTDESRDDYAAWFARFWAAMPDDTWLAVVDVHI